jgi:hypothetical protein
MTPATMLATTMLATTTIARQISWRLGSASFVLVFSLTQTRSFYPSPTGSRRSMSGPHRSSIESGTLVTTMCRAQCC